MSARALLARLTAAGVELAAEGDRLRYRGPAAALPPEILGELRERKPELLELLRPPAGRTLRAGVDGDPGELLARFLEDSSLPLAVFHSRALGRDFVLARDAEALAALTEAERGLPVLYFADCQKAAALGLEGLRTLLDTRAVFGPEVALRSVAQGPLS